MSLESDVGWESLTCFLQLDQAAPGSGQKLKWLCQTSFAAAAGGDAWIDALERQVRERGPRAACSLL